MKLKIKRAIAGATIASAGLAGTLGVGAMTAAPAQAKVDNGTYVMTTNTIGIDSAPARVVIRNNRLLVPGSPSLYIHPTPRGGYADFGITRYTFTKKGGNYYGRVMAGPIQVSTIKLVKR